MDFLAEKCLQILVLGFANHQAGGWSRQTSGYYPPKYGQKILEIKKEIGYLVIFNEIYFELIPDIKILYKIYIISTIKYNN